MLTKVWFQSWSTNGSISDHDNIFEQLLLEMLVFELSMLGQAET